MAPEPDSKRALALVMKLLAIRGPSGEESKVIQFVRDALRRAGVPARCITTDAVHRRSHLGGEVGNLIVKLPGTKRGPRRLLSAHVDTVPLCVGCKPVRRGNMVRSADKTTALGADDRSGVGAILTAALEIRRRGLAHPPLTLLFPVQEEVGLVGSRHVSAARLGRPALAFNFDSGLPERLITGATGAYRIVIHIEGIASHAGVHPEDGASAITIAAKAIAGLQDDDWLGRVVKGRRRGTSNVGVIEGGNATNVVTPHVKVRAEARSHDPRFRKQILDTIVRRFEQAARSVRNAKGRCGRVRFDSRLDYESFALSNREPCVRTATAAVRGIGKTAIPSTVDGGLDANWLTAKGIPTVTLGAGQHHPHTVNELLNVREYQDGCRLALRLATGTENE